MTSIWLDGRAPVASDAMPPDRTYDVVVVGAGLTGLTTALLLARAGKRVGVLEARSVGAVTTGHSSAKVSLLQGTKLSGLLSRQSQAVADAYVSANREGCEWLLRFCGDHGVAVQHQDAYTFAATPDQVEAARGELDAARLLGLPVRWTDRLDTPFPVHGAVTLPEQAQLDPMAVLDALVAELRRHGGRLHQDSRVVGVSSEEHPLVELADGTTVRSTDVVLATGVPTMDRGLYFLKVQAQRSYVLTVAGADPVDGMFLSAGAPTISLRTVPREAGTLLMVGGQGHVVGRARSAARHVDQLRAWAERHFPGSEVIHTWSAQDYSSHDGVPYVGLLPHGGGHIHVATGFDKWGMSNAVAAALTITGGIVGSLPSWSESMRSRITRPAGVAHLARTNLSVVGAALRSTTDLPTVVRQPGGVLPVCTHLGGILHWNDAERSWDCPLHGSRFDDTGVVLEGPAVRALRRTKGSPATHERSH